MRLRWTGAVLAEMSGRSSPAFDLPNVTIHAARRHGLLMQQVFYFVEDVADRDIDVDMSLTLVTDVAQRELSTRDGQVDVYMERGISIVT